MSIANKHVRHGYSTVRPYLYGPLDLADFVKQVFGAEEVEHVTDGNGVHIEVKIGDSLIAMDLGDHSGSDADPEWLTRSFVYVYVDDVDAVYQRALQAGATSMQEPTDKPYQERNASFKDSFGNIWGISTYMGSN